MENLSTEARTLMRREDRVGARGRTPSCPVRLSRAPAGPRGRDRGHSSQPHTPLLLTRVAPTACPGPGVRTKEEGKAGMGLGLSPAPGPPQDPGMLSAGGRGLDTMTLRGHYVTLLVLVVSLHSCSDRLKDHEAITSTKHVDLTNVCPGLLVPGAPAGDILAGAASCLTRLPRKPEGSAWCDPEGDGVLGSGVVGLQYSGMFTSARCLPEPTCP